MIMKEMEDMAFKCRTYFKSYDWRNANFKRLGINLEKYMEVLMNIRGNRK